MSISPKKTKIKTKSILGLQKVKWVIEVKLKAKALQYFKVDPVWIIDATFNSSMYLCEGERPVATLITRKLWNKKTTLQQYLSVFYVV